MTATLISWLLKLSDIRTLPLLMAHAAVAPDASHTTGASEIDSQDEEWSDLSPHLELDHDQAAFFATACAEKLTVVGSSQVTFQDRLSKGGQGTIYAATFRVSFGHPAVVCIAVKKFKRGMRGIFPEQMPRELWSPSCAHVCRPLGVLVAKKSDCMLMPRYTRDLRTEIESRMEKAPGKPPFGELVSVHIMMQLALGLKGLHDCGVYHRDIKAANVLVNARSGSEFYEVAIADFEGAEDSAGAGTRYWRAPEVLKTRGTSKPLVDKQWQAADIYSFGMTCYEVLTGEKPLDGLRMSEYKRVVEGHMRPELPSHVPKPLRKTIRRCWLHDPGARPSLDDVLEILKRVDGHRLASAGLGIPRSFMKMPGLLESLRPTLSHVLSAPQREDSERRTNFAFWLSEYVSTQEQFVSQFDMKAHLQNGNAHDSLMFAEFVERRRSLAFIRLQKDGSGHNIDATKDEYSRSGPIRVEARMCGPKILLPSEVFRRFSSSPPAGGDR